MSKRIFIISINTIRSLNIYRWKVSSVINIIFLIITFYISIKNIIHRFILYIRPIK